MLGLPEAWLQSTKTYDGRGDRGSSEAGEAASLPLPAYRDEGVGLLQTWIEAKMWMLTEHLVAGAEEGEENPQPLCRGQKRARKIQCHMCVFSCN